MNLTDINKVSVHQAYDEVLRAAQKRGVRVTGSELVGLIPLKSLLEAGRHYLKMQNRSLGVPEDEIIQIAVKSLGLDELKPFEPHKKIIEYFLETEAPPLASMTLTEFANETSRESPAPGGGSVAAYMAAMGTSLSAMVANLSANKRGWEERVEHFSEVAEILQQKKQELLDLVDEDTNAFNMIMDAFRLPKNTQGEKSSRKQAIEQATLNAIRIPLKVMQTAYDAMEPTADMAKNGNPNSVSDAGVGALALRSGIYGAYLNVIINASEMPDNESAKLLMERAEAVLAASLEKESEILTLVKETIHKVS